MTATLAHIAYLAAWVVLIVTDHFWWSLLPLILLLTPSGKRIG